MRLTHRICNELMEGDGTAYELAAELGLPWRTVSATISNLRRRGHLTVRGKIGRAKLYGFVSFPGPAHRPGSGRKPWSDFGWLEWLPLTAAQLSKKLGITAPQAHHKLEWALKRGKVRRVPAIWERA